MSDPMSGPSTDLLVVEDVWGPAFDQLARRMTVQYQPELWQDRAALVGAASRSRAIVVRNRTRVDAALFDAAPHLEVVELDELARRTGMPLATGENLYGAAAFTPYLAVDGVRIVQPDVTKVGGITEYLAVADAARTAGRTVNPHLYSGAVATAATVQAAASSPATGLVEWDVRANPLRRAADALLTDHGTIQVPDSPGLGIDLDHDQLATYEERLP